MTVLRSARKLQLLTCINFASICSKTFEFPFLDVDPSLTFMLLGA